MNEKLKGKTLKELWEENGKRSRFFSPCKVRGLIRFMLLLLLGTAGKPL